jgi:hypothetical protein
MPQVIQNHPKSMPSATLGGFISQKLAERIANVIFETQTRPATNSPVLPLAERIANVTFEAKTGLATNSPPPGAPPGHPPGHPPGPPPRPTGSRGKSKLRCASLFQNEFNWQVDKPIQLTFKTNSIDKLSKPMQLTRWQTTFWINLTRRQGSADLYLANSISSWDALCYIYIYIYVYIYIYIYEFGVRYSEA